uniref:Ntox44 domain-containing protein n=1 Tax=Bursaphelenchus xylophilus TaxID=6326 RepID=A0A1I7SJE1_BURXY
MFLQRSLPTREGIKVGLFTNWYDYEDITDHSRQVQAAEIWYWHAISEGPNGETSKDFRDFRPFGPFKGWPLAKQYGVEEKICNYNANVNVFPASSMNSNGDNSIPIGEGAAFVKSN